MSTAWFDLGVTAGATVAAFFIVALAFCAILWGRTQLQENGWGGLMLAGLLAVCMAAGTALGWTVSGGIADRGDGFIAFLLMFWLIGPLGFLALACMLPPRRRRGGPRRGGAGLAAAFFGGAGLCALGFAAVLSLPAASDGALRGADLRPVAMPLLALSAGLAVAGWRVRRQRRAASALAATTQDLRPPVLYLREFRHERQAFVTGDAQDLRPYLQNAVRWVPRWLQPDWADGLQAVTAEEYLSEAMSAQLGPFIALGSPLDGLPPLGAARDYADDAHWQARFLELAQRACAVVLVPGASEALAWEVRTLQRAGLAHKLFVLVGSDAFQPSSMWWVGRLHGWKNPDWTAFRALLQKAGYRTPPQAPRPWSVLGFDHAAQGSWLADGTAVAPTLFANALAAHLDLTSVRPTRPPRQTASVPGPVAVPPAGPDPLYAAPPAPALPPTLAQEMADITSGRAAGFELRMLGAISVLVLPVIICLSEALPFLKSMKFGFEGSFGDHLAITALAGVLSFLPVAPRGTRWMAVMSGSLAGMGAYMLGRLLFWGAEHVRMEFMFVCVIVGAAPGIALMVWSVSRHLDALDAQDARHAQHAQDEREAQDARDANPSR